MTTDGAGRSAVKVDTEHGKVTLHGTVDSEAVKEKAEAATRAVGGVTDVRNLLQVVKESRQDSGGLQDRGHGEVSDSVGHSRARRGSGQERDA
jgi:BON domain